MKNNIIALGASCSGCRSCQYSCPVQAITFSADAEGFQYPVVEETKCIDCGKCTAACPVIKPVYTQQPQTGYAACIKDEIALTQSTSGGVFTVLADYVLEQQGVVFGCAYVHGEPKHIKAETAAQLALLRGSKYVQSNMEDIYPQVKAELEAQRYVLFSGTPCQVAGLKRYLHKDYQRLLCVDIICHGTPSRLLFDRYLQWLGGRYGGKVTAYDFRSKRRNDWSLTYRAQISRAAGAPRYIEAIASLDPYYYAFLQGSTYRRSCYSCPYSCLSRAGDITLGDFWGVEQVCPQMHNPRGTSAVIVNSPKGEAVFRQVQHLLTYRQVDVAAIQAHNGNLRQPSPCPAERDVIYSAVEHKGFAYAARRYMTHPKRPVEQVRNLFSNRFRQRIKALLKR